MHFDPVEIKPPDITGNPMIPKRTNKRRLPGGRYCILLFLCFAGFCFYHAYPLVINRIGGAFLNDPGDLGHKASKAALALVDKAFKDIAPEKWVDYHVHAIGLNTGNNGAFVNPKMKTWRHPVERLKFSVYKSAAGIKSNKTADSDYMNRLVGLINSTGGHGRYLLLAFDKNYHPDGSVNLEKTTFYVPNEYVFKLATTHADIFIPAVSIHPYRKDAVMDLEKWAKKGVRFVKWLPNAMGIDPSSPRVEPFYEKMKRYNMILLSHGGEEQAVKAEKDQALGNPLLLRKPLDYGVRVIVAHCAGLGMCADLDNPGKGDLPCFELFMRLMDEKQYDGLLFGDISAQVQFNRMPGPISTILERQDLHHRLVNGSDYPLPAINVLLRTGDLADDGFITKKERILLNEIYDYNPLLFDFVLKRTVRHPESGQKLAPSIFMVNPGLEN